MYAIENDATTRVIKHSCATETEQYWPPAVRPPRVGEGARRADVARGVAPDTPRRAALDGAAGWWRVVVVCNWEEGTQLEGFVSEPPW